MKQDILDTLAANIRLYPVSASGTDDLLELTSGYTGPDPADVLRTVGAPSSDGKCTTSDGQTVQIF